MQRFDWDDLKYLLAVARAGSVSAAARALTVDHATVIRRLEALEGAVGVKLFQRNPRGYHLTHNGERLLVSAQSIEKEASRATVELSDGQHPVSGTLRISALEGFGNFFLARRLAAFGLANPDLSIEFITLQQLVALSRREADIAITLQPPTQGRFHITHLTDYVLHVYGTADYLGRSEPIRAPGDINRHRFTGYIDDLVFVRDLNYLDEVGYLGRLSLQSSSIQVQLEIALQGYGLCVLPRFIALQHPELRSVLPEQITLRRAYWIVSNSDVAGSSRGRALIDFLKREAATSQAMFVGDSPRPRAAAATA